MNKQFINELYGDVELYKIDSGKSTIEDVPGPEFTKDVLVILSSQPGPSLQEFLNKVLSAVNVGATDYDLSIEKPARSFSSKYIISFGSSEINNPLYEIAQNSNSKILYADKLAEIEQNRDLKIKLWNSLKIMFGV